MINEVNIAFDDRNEIEQYIGKFIVCQNNSEYEDLPTVKFCGDDYSIETYERTCVNSYSWVVSVCDTEEEAKEHTEKKQRIHKEFLTANGFTEAYSQTSFSYQQLIKEE